MRQLEDWKNKRVIVKGTVSLVLGEKGRRVALEDVTIKNLRTKQVRHVKHMWVKVRDKADQGSKGRTIEFLGKVISYVRREEKTMDYAVRPITSGQERLNIQGQLIESESPLDRQKITHGSKKRPLVLREPRKRRTSVLSN